MHLHALVDFKATEDRAFNIVALTPIVKPLHHLQERLTLM